MIKGAFTVLSGIMIIASGFCGDGGEILLAIHAVTYAILANVWKDGEGNG